MRKLAQYLGLTGEKPVPDFEIPLLPEDLLRLKGFLTSRFWNREAIPTTEVWDKYSTVCETSFYWDNGKLWYKDIVHGLDKQFPNLFGYKRTQSIGQELKRWLLKRLGAWHGPLLFSAQSSFKKGALSFDDLKKHFNGIVSFGPYLAGSYYNDIAQAMQSAGKKQVDAVIEIGPGSGKLLSLIKKHHPECKIAIVDLPTSMVFSFSYLKTLFPDSSYSLPHEAEPVSNCQSLKDINFYTPEQIEYIPTDCFDIGVNTASFGEMRKEVIDEYFSLLRRVFKQNNIFYCNNRIEKIMSYDGMEIPIRFTEYPWLSSDVDYIYNVCKFRERTSILPFFKKATKLHVSHDGHTKVWNE